MKKLYAILLIVSFEALVSYSQVNQNWKWLHEKPQGNNLRWVKVWDANNWYAGGNAGTFMKTSDGGNTWYFHHKSGVPGSTTGGNTGGYYTIYDAHFFNKDTGVLVGQAGMMRTTDGGVTFYNVTDTITGSTWNKLYFVNNNVGYAAGNSYGRLVKTTDAGITWIQNQNIPAGKSYSDIYCPDLNTIILSASGGTIMKSTDGGDSFTPYATGVTSNLNKLTFKDANNGWAVGASGSALYTTDGGLTWTNASTGLPSTSTFYDVDYRTLTSPAGTEQVVLTGDSKFMYATTDRGLTWTTINFLAPLASQPITSTYYATDFLVNDFVTVGALGLINSSFGNTLTEHAYVKKSGTIYDIWVNNSGKIITVGAPSASGVYDQILTSTDDGTTWNVPLLSLSKPKLNKVIEVSPEEVLTSSSASTFYSIKMINDNLGFVVGSNSAVYKTTNGGASWDSLVTTIDTGLVLSKVDFVSASTGWIFSNTADAAGTIWKTTNGGINWVRQTLTGQTGINTRIINSNMMNDSIGWVVSAKPRPYKTTDGGSTWNEESISDINYTGTLTAIQMIDKNLGYMVGSLYRFFRTTDGGQNWLFDTIPNYPPSTLVLNLNSLKFADANHGFVGCTGGLTFFTKDGGVTWDLINTAGSTLNTIFTTSSNNSSLQIYAAGNSGNIFKYSDYLVPVELTSFSAYGSARQVILTWITATELNNSGFSIQRKTERGEFNDIAFIKGYGTSTSKHIYQYNDKVLNGKYTYRLKQIDYNGIATYSKEVDVNIDLPGVYQLLQNYPNPFNPLTTIKFSIPDNEFVNLSVYNLLGRKVAQILNENKKSGIYEINFNASSLSSGIYFYKISAGKFSEVKKMTILK